MPARKHILVVEDDPLVADIVLNTLGDDYQVSQAADAGTVPILLMSGSPERVNDVRGGRAFLLKPCSLAALLDRVAATLEC